MDVQNAFQYALESYPSDDLTEMVLRSIIAGAESEVPPINDRLFETILTASRGNNTELRMQLAYYIHLLGPKAPNNWSVHLQSHLMKRDTTWNEKNKDYNMVEDLNTRNFDVRSYPKHQAYIWGKSFGIPQINLGAAFGAFAGFGGQRNPSSFKLFAKGVARAYAFGHSKTFFEALLSSENKPGEKRIDNRLYVSLAGKVLVDYSKEIPLCKSWKYPLYRSPEYTLLEYAVPFFIYVGFLRFEVSLSTQLGIDADLGACIDQCASVKGALLPSLTLSASAAATASILVGHMILCYIKYLI